MDALILKDVLISLGELERYYEGVVPIDLWRGLNVKKDSELFSLIEEPYKMSNGRIRRPDITIKNGRVEVQHWPRGISTFDRPGVPTGKDWTYYKIPADTVLPEGLAIVKDSYNEILNATHYTIAPAYSMSLGKFKCLLNELAKNAKKDAA